MNYAPDVYTATLVMATAASIDWNRANSVVSYAFRKQTGLAASVTDDDSATALLLTTLTSMDVTPPAALIFRSIMTQKCLAATTDLLIRIST